MCRIIPHAPHPLAGATRIHLQMSVDDLEEFRRLRDPPGLEFRPNRHIVDANLECARRHELTFDGVADKEDHHASVHLVLQGPGERARCVNAHHGERVEGGQDTNDECKFEITHELGQLHFPIWRRVVVSLDRDTRVFLLQYTRILLKYLSVTS